MHDNTSHLTEKELNDLDEEFEKYKKSATDVKDKVLITLLTHIIYLLRRCVISAFF